MRNSRFIKAAMAAAMFAGICGAAYGTYSLVTFATYGKRSIPIDADSAADRFMPVYEVLEEQHIFVRAPADVTISAACRLNIEDSPIVRLLFKGRELLLHAVPNNVERPRSFVAWAQSLGWRVLLQNERQIIFGSVTQPWKPNVVFHGLSPAEFAAFNRPGYVKILFTLRAKPVDSATSVFHTETRVVSTDPSSHEAFRRYWAVFSPGIILIRYAVLPMVKAAAEKR